MAVFDVYDPKKQFSSGAGGSRQRSGSSALASTGGQISAGGSSKGSMSWDKHVKGATKSKHAPPKAKYIDPLVQGTFEGEYTVSDIAQSIAPKLRDSNSTVVFKALIVVHTILRSGNQKSVYVVLSSKPHLLGLNSVTSGHDSVQNLTKYAFYLHSRLKTYAALGRDAIRDRAERRAEGRGDGGEKLRSLTVERGLLREVATLQKLLDALLECKFYTEDKEDEVTMSALRLLVKDLLILFTSVNEGVINVLEHYFEMSHVDATTSLKIYKAFCKQTEKVVTYLGVAKKMQNVLNVQIPNLKHAPVSLAGSLEEYIKDPNFEANRLEYKNNREIAEGKPSKPPAKTESNGAPSTPKKSTPTTTPSNGASTSTAEATNSKPSADGSKAFVDFFESIEQEQTSMFDPQTGSPNQAYFQQQAAYNPFLQQQVPMAMGMPFGAQGLMPQMTGAMAFGQLQPQQGMLSPQMTGFGAFGGMNAFGQPQQPQMQPQQTGFLQPQATGFNPFRQSMIMPQMTGMNLFGQQQQPQPQQQQQQQQQQQMYPASAQQAQTPTSPSHNSVKQLQPQWTGMNAFQRPSSPPVAGGGSSAFGLGSISEQPAGQNNNMSSAFGMPSQNQQQQQSTPHPLAPQPTGSKNPFAPPPGSVPAEAPKPPAPSMNQIAFQAFQNMQLQNQNQNQNQQQQQQQQQTQTQQQPPQSQPTGQNGFSGNNSSGFDDMFGSSSSSFGNQPKSQVPQQTGLMSSVASDFSFGRALSPANNNFSSSSGLPASTAGNLPSFGNGNGPSSATSPSLTSSSNTAPSLSFSGTPSFGTGASGQTTGSSAFTSSQTGTNGQQQQHQQQAQPLQPQATGFGGSSIKPFQPSSSFGASLWAEHGGKPGGSGGATSPGTQQNQQPQQTGNLLGGFGSAGNAFGSNSSGQQQAGQGQSQPQALQPQQTGTPNPFRMSTMPGGGNNNAQGGLNNAFNPSFFGSSKGGQQQQQQPQQTSNNNSSQWGSLI